jgi:CheY-like chemotaxis protein
VKLGDVTPETVHKAVAVFLDLAYGGGGRPRRMPEPNAGGAEDGVLAMFQKERVEEVPGYSCVRYTMRLGNRNYPFMKLVLQEHLLAGEFFFAVDTHDEMNIKPDFPDYEAWMAVRRFNRDLKRRIETQLDAEGLDTAATIRRLCAARACADGSGSCGTVLVVDDEEDLAESVSVLLRNRGFRTIEVHDGPAALRACAELAPDLVLLDYEMPEMDGMQVIARLRNQPVTQGIPILLTSAGKVSMADIRAADGFLQKPFQETLLYEMVRRVLQNAREARL